jgi:hypothetical protein
MISVHLLYFRFNEPVYYKLDDSDFPSDTREGRGHWVGVAEHVGHHMTFKILTDDTLELIYRSNVRSALDPNSRNLRIDPLNDDKPIKEILKFRNASDSSTSSDHGEGEATSDVDMSKGDPPQNVKPIVNPIDLIGWTHVPFAPSGRWSTLPSLNC